MIASWTRLGLRGEKLNQINCINLNIPALLENQRERELECRLQMVLLDHVVDWIIPGCDCTDKSKAD
jgi:hypothetical protein